MLPGARFSGSPALNDELLSPPRSATAGDNVTMLDAFGRVEVERMGVARAESAREHPSTEAQRPGSRRFAQPTILTSLSSAGMGVPTARRQRDTKNLSRTTPISHILQQSQSETTFCSGL